MNFIRTSIDKNHAVAPISRVTFNAADPTHRMAFKSFIETGRWGQLQFSIDGDFTCVPDMIKHKLLNFYLSADRKLSK